MNEGDDPMEAPGPPPGAASVPPAFTTPKGVPDGWRAYERAELMLDPWRFYRIVDSERRSSIVEDNWVVRGDQAAAGQEGLVAFMKEQRLLSNPEAIPPATLAAQMGMFLVRGHSRRSCNFQVVTDPGAFTKDPARLQAPETRVQSGVLTHRSVLKLDGRNFRFVTVTMTSGGQVKVDTRDEVIPD